MLLLFFKDGLNNPRRLILLYIDLRPGQTCHSKDVGSCIFHWRGRPWLTIWDRVKISWYSHKLMHQKRVISARWGSNMPFQRRRKCIFRWPVMGRDWVDVELLYNSVHRKFNEFPDQTSWGSDAVVKASTQQRESSGPRLISLGIRRVGEMML